MNELSKTVSSGLTSAFRDFAVRVHTLSENLTDEQFWTKPYPYGNSFGHLVLHLTGNLEHFIGAAIAQTGYVRERELEFTDRSAPAKEETLRRMDEAVSMVLATLEAQTAEMWSQPYEAEGASENVRDRFSMFLRCAAHFNHHVGQMIYLEMELKK